MPSPEWAAEQRYAPEEASTVGSRSGSRTPARGSNAGMTISAVAAAVIIATHMIIETWPWILSGDSHSARQGNRDAEGVGHDGTAGAVDGPQHVAVALAAGHS